MPCVKISMVMRLIYLPKHDEFKGSDFKID